MSFRVQKKIYFIPSGPHVVKVSTHNGFLVVWHAGQKKETSQKERRMSKRVYSKRQDNLHFSCFCLFLSRVSKLGGTGAGG